MWLIDRVRFSDLRWKQFAVVVAAWKRVEESGADHEKGVNRSLNAACGRLFHTVRVWNVGTLGYACDRMCEVGGSVDEFESGGVVHEVGQGDGAELLLEDAGGALPDLTGAAGG